MITPSKVHSCCHKLAEFPPPLWLKNILLYIYPISFIYSSISGCLCCIHVLAIVNNVTVNKGCSYLFDIVFSFPSDIYPEEDIIH